MFSRFFSRMQLLRCSGTSPGKGQPLALLPLPRATPMETRGLEPLTSCLQSRRSPN